MPKLGLQFPESSTGFLVHCVLEGRHVTAAVLPVKHNIWQVTHGRRSSVVSLDRLLFFFEGATDSSMIASFHLGTKEDMEWP